MICKNCEHEVLGRFCSFCGQKASEQPVTLDYFSQQLLSRVNPLHAGNATLLGFILRPVQTIVDFIGCKRMQIAQPLSVLFITSGLYLLLHAYLTGHAYTAHLNPSDGQNMLLVKRFLQMYYQNLGFSLLLTVWPFSWLTFLSFKRAGFSFAEHLVINLYLVSYGLLLSILKLVLDTLAQHGLELLSPTLFSLLFYSALGLLFSKVVTAEYNLRVLAQYLFLVLLFMVLLTIAGVAVLWLLQ